MGFEDRQGAFTPLDGQIDGHLGDLVDVGLQPPTF
jgi:hypothetical protein